MRYTTMNQNYEPEFKKKIVRLHLEEGRTLRGLAEEYGISKASISIWTKQFREECQENVQMLIIIILKIEKRIIGNAKMKSKIQSVRFITHMAGLTAIVPFTFTLAGKAIQSAG